MSNMWTVSYPSHRPGRPRRPLHKCFFSYVFVVVMYYYSNGLVHAMVPPPINAPPLPFFLLAPHAPPFSHNFHS